MVRGLVVTLTAAVGLWLLAILVLITLGRRSAARELATLIPNLVILFRGLLRDPRVPRSSKLWLGFATVWLVSPIDLIPEFIPLIGSLDDAIVAALGESGFHGTLTNDMYNYLDPEEGARRGLPRLLEVERYLDLGS